MKYKQGDLLEAFDNREIDVIIHQCNCVAGFDAGIAKLIKNKYKGAEDFDILVRESDCFGGMSIYPITHKKAIINLYSQYYTGSPSNKIINNNLKDNLETRIEALQNSLESVKSEYRNKKHIKFGLPLIASGLAADKKLKSNMVDLEYFKKYIACVIESIFDDTYDITVYYL